MQALTIDEIKADLQREQRLRAEEQKLQTDSLKKQMEVKFKEMEDSQTRLTRENAGLRHEVSALQKTVKDLKMSVNTALADRVTDTRRNASAFVEEEAAKVMHSKRKEAKQNEKTNVSACTLLFRLCHFPPPAMMMAILTGMPLPLCTYRRTRWARRQVFFFSFLLADGSSRTICSHHHVKTLFRRMALGRRGRRLHPPHRSDYPCSDRTKSHCSTSKPNILSPLSISAGEKR